jgi:hypothetical protein
VARTVQSGGGNRHAFLNSEGLGGAIAESLLPAMSIGDRADEADGESVCNPAKVRIIAAPQVTRNRPPSPL